MNTSPLPVAVIGAGPVGLAGAAHLLSRGERPIVLEAGSEPAANIRQWAHVRTFSAWRENVDSVAREMLEAADWQPPAWNVAPTGGEFIDRYLQPLADLPEIREHLRLGARVTGISRLGFDKMKSGDRDDAPFLLQVSRSDGSHESLIARAVIDASGTFASPNPLGAFGVPAEGESKAASHIFYGIPDVLDAQRGRYAGRRVLVVGAGHSAFNALLDLAKLQKAEPTTTLTWAIRSTPDGSMYGGGAGDALPLRGALGTAMKDLVASGKLRFVSGFPITALRQEDDAVYVRSFDGEIGPFDEIVCATGFRPDLSLTRELRVALDPTVEAPPALAPLIDPNVHSCGTVPPHGVDELSHPEPGFYMVGMKSYGRAPTFLMLTGYEQVRSVVAELVGDHEGAREVRLELPATGVCSTGGPQLDDATATAASGCCGPTAKSVIDLGSAVAEPTCATPVAAGAGVGGCR